jgi:hypothetical protein
MILDGMAEKIPQRVQERGQLSQSGDFTHDWHRPLGHSGRARSNPKPGLFGVKLTYNALLVEVQPLTPRKSGSGLLRCWRDPFVAHVSESGFGPM